MRPGIAIVEFGGDARMFGRELGLVPCWYPSDVSGNKKCEREHAVCGRIPRISLDGLPQHRDSSFTVGRVSTSRKPTRRVRRGSMHPDPQSIGFQHEYPLRPKACGSIAACDARRYLILKRKNVGEVAVVSFRPNVVTRDRVDQLASDAHPLAALADAAFEHIAHTSSRPTCLMSTAFPL